MIYAPICIPTLCRSEHFIRQIESLKRNTWAKYTDVYIAIDYPPSERYRKGWEEINNYVDNGDFSVFNKFVVFKRTENLGASNNSIALKEYVAERYDRWIRSDDDVEFSPNFIEYMDKCLEKYEDDDDVMNVVGYSYPIDWNVSEGATCLKQNINVSMWGVGYWRRKEQHYWPYLCGFGTIKKLPIVLKEKRYTKMIDAALFEYIRCASSWFRRDKNVGDSTDIGRRICLAVEGKYCISPVISKARNYGFDGSGLYCDNTEGIGSYGNTARTYNYSEQPIDSETSFDLIPDNLHDFEENRKRLNVFDYRSPSYMARTHRLIWLMEHIGIWSAKLYTLLCMPYDYTPKVIKKIIGKMDL